MTIVTRYSVTPEPGDWADAHFELRLNDDERPFHIALRRLGAAAPAPRRKLALRRRTAPAETVQLAVNRMAGGSWGSESVHDLADPAAARRALTVEVVGTRVHVLAGEEILSFDMSVSQNEVTLAAAAKNMGWSVETGPHVVAMLRADGTGDAAMAAQVRIGHRVLDLPGSGPRGERAALLQAAAADPGIYLRFVAGRPLCRPGTALTVLDIDPDTAFYAVSAAVLFEGAAVHKLGSTRSRDRFVTDLAAANRLDGLQIADRDRIAALLAEAPGPVLIQGGGAFDRFGDEIAALPAAARARLSVWTTADDIVPGNRVFPCANAQIRMAPDWEFNHNAAIDLSGRRPGLDIAIAAYNARDYLIECATSLLCEGRDDIRVIVVDDGSTDGSGEMAARHFADEPRLRVEHKPNGGCASARNYGRLMSDATHLAFVDADDFVSPDFFARLYDLALYSGCEVVQAGFDFYDESRGDPYYPSYEDEMFADVARAAFGDQPVIRLQAHDIIKGQPTIWRKVYRRDFLDARKIYFPENVRAYDDYIFQMFSLTAARDVLMLPEPKYHYRQHPAQDIKQGDERHFYMLYMFGMLLKRSVEEGWPNFRPYAESVIDCISWSGNILRPDLVDSFLAASARICVAIAKTYGTDLIEDLLERVEHPDFVLHYRTEQTRAKTVAHGAFWSHFNAEIYHPDMLAMRHALHKAI